MVLYLFQALHWYCDNGDVLLHQESYMNTILLPIRLETLVQCSLPYLSITTANRLYLCKLEKRSVLLETPFWWSLQEEGIAAR
jgi:hypothetical protein